MGFIFGSGTVKGRLIWAVKMAIRHGTILALFAFTYKAVCCLLAQLTGKARPIHSFIAGAIGSMALIRFNTDLSINRQIGYYLSARVMEGIILKLMKMGYLPNLESFRATYTMIWALVMFLYMLDEKILNKSLVDSMHFIYDD